MLVQIQANLIIVIAYLEVRVGIISRQLWQLQKFIDLHTI